VHMHGPIDNPKHAFNGLTFVHAERLDKGGWAAPAFAAFVSSVIETGTKPEDMDGIRARLKELKLEPYDCLSPTLMDLLAANAVKVNGVSKPAMS
jgi:S-(hydroxymethyl)glutathione synthase